MRRILGVSVVAVSIGVLAGPHAGASQSNGITSPPFPPALADAQTSFYNAHYDAAAALTRELCSAAAGDLAACELRTSALLFELKRALGEGADKDKAFAQCTRCPALVEAFLKDTAVGQAVARGFLRTNPGDETALFFLGKLDLNYVWLQLGPLGHKKGWDEYWEARKSLDAVLKRNARHVRARVARAWIDYIVDTRMPRLTRWILGGGSRTRALLAIREAADTDADFFTNAEATFALWELQVREKNLAEAITIAKRLSRDFPANTDLIRFLDAHDRSLSQRE